MFAPTNSFSIESSNGPGPDTEAIAASIPPGRSGIIETVKSIRTTETPTAGGGVYRQTKTETKVTVTLFGGKPPSKPPPRPKRAKAPRAKRPMGRKRGRNRKGRLPKMKRQRGMRPITANASKNSIAQALQASDLVLIRDQDEMNRVIAALDSKLPITQQSKTGPNKAAKKKAERWGNGAKSQAADSKQPLTQQEKQREKLKQPQAHTQPEAQRESIAADLAARERINNITIIPLAEGIQIPERYKALLGNKQAAAEILSEEQLESLQENGIKLPAKMKIPAAQEQALEQYQALSSAIPYQQGQDQKNASALNDFSFTSQSSQIRKREAQKLGIRDEQPIELTSENDQKLEQAIEQAISERNEQKEAKNQGLEGLGFSLGQSFRSDPGFRSEPAMAAKDENQLTAQAIEEYNTSAIESSAQEALEPAKAKAFEALSIPRDFQLPGQESAELQALEAEFEEAIEALRETSAPQIAREDIAQEESKSERIEFREERQATDTNERQSSAEPSLIIEASSREGGPQNTKSAPQRPQAAKIKIPRGKATPGENGAAIQSKKGNPAPKSSTERPQSIKIDRDKLRARPDSKFVLRAA